MSEKGFVSVPILAPAVPVTERRLALAAGKVCVRCGAAATTARTRRFGLVKVSQGHCDACAARHRRLAIASILRTALGLVTAVALAWGYWLVYQHRPVPYGWGIMVLLGVFSISGIVLDRARPVRWVGFRQGRVLLSIESQEGARAFLDANGLETEKVHASLAEAIAGVK